MMILPFSWNRKRKNDRARVDLPEPVLPQIPIFSLGLIVKLTPRRTGSSYRQLDLQPYSVVCGAHLWGIPARQILDHDRPVDRRPVRRRLNTSSMVLLFDFQIQVCPSALLLTPDGQAYTPRPARCCS